jgi:hypothetical protein
MEADLPHVERAVRLVWQGADVRTAEHAFEERIGFADAAFFDVFTFPLRAGSRPAQPGDVLLSETAARKYFGDANPLGQRLTLAFGADAPHAVTVRGVAAPFPNNASLRFDLLLPFDALPEAGVEDWSAADGHTFLLLRRAADLDAVAAQMAPYPARFTFERLTDPAPEGYAVLRRPAEAPHPAFALIMVALAGFMMALSCFNYVNIALGSAAGRRKEIGVRKVMGGSKRDLVLQYLGENLLLCALALGLGVVIAWLGLVPLFNRTFVLDIELSLVEDLGLWAFLVGLLGVVAVVSGAYPALYVASFQPAEVFRGEQQAAETRWLTRGLLTAQFVIASLAVLATVFLVMNGRYLLGQDWGYDPEATLVVRLSAPEQADLLRDAALEHAAVQRVATADDHVGTRFDRIDYAAPGGEERQAFVYNVGPGYPETLGLALYRGRSLDVARSDVVLVNQRLVELHGWDDPIGQPLRIGDESVTVAGVLEDFVQMPLVRVQPTVMRPVDAARFLIVRAVPEQHDAVLAHLETRWHALVPDQPFDAFSQAEVFADRFASYQNLVRSVGVLAGLALLVASMGLYGLASQNAARRLKEVCVRKVLGAGVPHIVLLVNRPFLVLLTVASALATAVLYGGLRFAMSFDVANLMPLTPLPFVFGYALLLATFGASVAAQSRSLARADPAQTLRRA